MAWHLLADDRLDTLITHRFPAEKSAEGFQVVDKHPEESIQVLLTY
jgi:threonine dehydrogenase-like Zn-dependent dehydrogenase